MTVMPQPDERKNTIIPLRNLNNSGTEDKNSFPLLSSPLFGAYLKQWSADKDTRTLSGTRVTFWWVLCKFVDRENKLKKKKPTGCCFVFGKFRERICSQILFIETEGFVDFLSRSKKKNSRQQLNEAMPNAFEVLAIHPFIRLFGVAESIRPRK